MKSCIVWFLLSAPLLTRSKDCVRKWVLAFMGEGSTNHLPRAFFSIFLWRSAPACQFHSLGQGSVHSSSASWDDCGREFPEPLYLLDKTHFGMDGSARLGTAAVLHSFQYSDPDTVPHRVSVSIYVPEISLNVSTIISYVLDLRSHAYEDATM